MFRANFVVVKSFASEPNASSISLAINSKLANT